MTAGWAEALAGAAPVHLVSAGVRLLAGAWATPDRLGGLLRAMLEASEEVEIADVLARLERGALAAGAAAAPARADAIGRRLAALGARMLLPDRVGYPERLAEVWPDRGAPAWLLVRSSDGHVPAGPSVAIVGTRHPTLDGCHTARELARLLARRGVVVVSGMARGIDQAAHRGALEAGGRTVAVLGAGFDVDYPRGDGPLRREIAASGALVTELAPDIRPAPRNFLARNRIVSGLAQHVVVVEGRAQSGAQQTARLGAAQGREVWAVPGSINAPTSRAPLDLIRDGATVVTRLDDVLESVAPSTPTLDLDGVAGDLRPPLAGVARQVLRLLGATPSSPGGLASAAGLGLPDVLAALSELTALGLAVQTPRGIVTAAR